MHMHFEPRWLCQVGTAPVTTSAMYIAVQSQGRSAEADAAIHAGPQKEAEETKQYRHGLACTGAWCECYGLEEAACSRGEW